MTQTLSGFILITLYATQSSTYQAIDVNPVYRTATKIQQMDRRELYTSFSRITHKNGLFITGNFELPGPVPDDDEVKLEMDRLRREAPFKLELVFLQDYLNDHNTLKIIFHNVQSLSKHLKFIQKDRFYQSADILNFTQGWIDIHKIRDLNIPGYIILNILNRNQALQNRTIGSIIYLKESLKENFSLKECQIHQHGSIEHEYFSVQIYTIFEVTYISVYKSPDFPFGSFIDILVPHLKRYGKSKTIVAGDFNINLLESSNTTNSLMNHFLKFNFKQITPKEYSTNGKTQIDLAFSNFSSKKEHLKCGYFEIIFSYHKLIWLISQKN